jgi:hypothetical protein
MANSESPFSFFLLSVMSAALLRTRILDITMVNFTFVPQHNPDGRSQRVRGRKACGNCRFKKVNLNVSSPDPLARLTTKHLFQRRCYHYRRSSSPDRSSRNLPSDYTARCNIDARGNEPDQTHDPPAKRSCTRPDTATDSFPAGRQSPRLSHMISPPCDAELGRQDDPSVLEGEPPPRFVGDLNPEARLLGDRTTPGRAQDISPGRVGVWVQPRSRNRCSPLEDTLSISLSSRDRIANPPRPPLSDLIDGAVISVLTDLYFANIHPIIPLLDEQEFRQHLSQHKVPMALIHVVCLIAAKDDAASPHLKLLESGESSVSVRSFCAQLHKSVTTMISDGSKFRKIALLRILGLLSLHYEGCDGAEQASSHIAQAMHHAQTLAWHLNRPDDEDFEMKRTFWCLWTLDRLNAATNSRPCIMNDLDIAIKPLTPSQSKSVAFDIWFRIANTLNSVIGIYRPTNPETITGIESYAGFEQIVDEMEGWHLTPSTLGSLTQSGPTWKCLLTVKGTLHVFFLATAILSHRLKTINRLPISTAARLRQQLSAIQIIRYMQDDDRLQSLHPMPVTVYAASLALSVSYQQLRYSRLSSDQEEAYQDFSAACDILEALQQKWSAADAMASLGRRIAIELEKTPNLAMLRVDRQGAERNEIRPRSRNRHHLRSTIEDLDQDAWVPDPAVASGQVEEEGYATRPEALDLFGGMDDLSWMYLNAENPISFGSLPLIDFELGFPE